MITHEMLVNAVLDADFSITCAGHCDTGLPCHKCVNKMVTKYEDSVRADAMRVFKEWFKGSKYCECFSGNIDEVMAEFEQEGKEGEQIG